MVLTAMPAMMALAICVRPVIHKSRNAEVKHTWARSMISPKARPNRAAMPSLGASNILATAQTMKPRNSAIPMRKRLLACAWWADSGCGADTFCSFTGMRKTGSRLTLAPASEPMAVAMAKNQACSENCGMPVKNAARLQPMARRAPKPAMMPPTSA